MKKIMIAIFALSSIITMAQQSKETTPTLKSILLEQLKTTHNNKDWFVPVNIAIEGLTPEQANWNDGTGNHSIAQLTSHLIFWNNQVLAKFKGENPEAFNGNNNETFKPYTKKEWDEAVKKIDAILTEWENLVQQADENILKDWYSTIAHIGTHNAYHTGQIIYIRKQQGSWEGDKGVK